MNDVIYRRGSTRRMDASLSLPREAMEAALAVALRGIDVPHFVAVHGVDGVEPGLYRWPDLASPVYAGNLRQELYRVATGQGLAGDAAFVVIGAADLTSIFDRRYRDLQFAAGLVEGRLHLAAYALGYGASGMTFLDSEIPGLLRGPRRAARHVRRRAGVREQGRRSARKAVARAPGGAARRRLAPARHHLARPTTSLARRRRSSRREGPARGAGYTDARPPPGPPGSRAGT